MSGTEPYLPTPAQQEKGTLKKGWQEGQGYSPGSQEVLPQGAQGGQGAQALLPALQARQSQGLPGTDVRRS